MKKALAIAHVAVAAFMLWALYIDITQDKNEWWGTALLVALLTLAAISAAQFFYAGRKGGE